MKIRAGFVSNSSSTSFCIYGAYLQLDELKKLIPNKGNVDYFGFIDNIKPKDLECYSSPDDNDAVYLGASWSSIKDDETGKQFMQRVEAAFKKMFGKNNVVFGTFEESWYDG